MRRRFHSLWLVEAPAARVWDELADVARWPEWWPGVESVTELAAGDADRVGSVYRSRWRAAAGYAVEFDFRVEHVDAPREMRGRAAGMLSGEGVWRLEPRDGATAVTYDWDVSAPWWMALIGPVTSWSHDRLMRRGGEALAERLATKGAGVTRSG